jgi:hypothetical protein
MICANCAWCMAAQAPLNIMNPPELPVDGPSASPDSERRRLNAWAFVAVVLAPTLLTVLAVSVGDKKGDLPPTIAMLGGGLAGIIAGVMLGRRLGTTVRARIGLSILFSLVMVVVCIGMSCFGCVASGYGFPH